MVALLAVPEGARFSELERLRRPPTRTTGTSMAKALEQVVSWTSASTSTSCSDSPQAVAR